MNETANPFVMAFLFILRCLIPLGILLGISYLLRRMELIIEPPAPPKREPQSGAAPVEAKETPAAKHPVARPPSSKKKKSSGKKSSAPKRKKKES